MSNPTGVRQQRIVNQLGMSHGAAAGRLRKMVLFHTLKRHAENNCAKCLNVIETADELSIEHLKPWEGRSVELFWDLNNIAFSHLRCNTPHKAGGPTVRITPDGMNWCFSCKAFLPVAEFHAAANRRTGLSHQCKTCKEKHRTYERRS